MLDRLVSEKWLKASGVATIWKANRVGDDIEVTTSDGSISKFHTLRQQSKKAASASNLALADFIAPKESGIIDHLGGFAVTTGHGIQDRVKAYEADHDDYNAILLKALADRLAEAFAEFLHKKIRTEIWGYAKNESLENDALIKEAYQGIRPAPGYPACPDHTEKARTVPVACCGREHRHRIDGKPGHVPSSLGEWMVLRTPTSQVLWPR